MEDEFFDLIGQIEIDPVERENLDRQFRVADATAEKRHSKRRLSKRKKKGIIRQGQVYGEPVRCIHCDKKIHGKHVATTDGPLHEDCVDEWGGHHATA